MTDLPPESAPAADAPLPAPAPAPAGEAAPGAPERKPAEERRPAWKRAADLALVLVLALAFRSSIASAYDVPTGSMVPTVLPGDRIVATQASYGLRVPFTDTFVAGPEMPARGDIVVFRSLEKPENLLKRVVAVAGDVLEIRGGRLVVNGVEAALEPAGHDAEGASLYHETIGAATHLVRLLPRQPFLRDVPPQTIPRGCFFAMGDNRDLSRDSRVFGPVPADRLLGRGRRVLFSIDRQRAAWVRPERTGVGLE